MICRDFQIPQFGHQFWNGLLLLQVVKILQQNFVQLSAARFVLDMSGRRHLKFVVGKHLHGLLVWVSLTILQPANHPFVYGLATDKRHSMRAGPHHETNILLCSVKLIPFLSFLIYQVNSFVSKVKLIVLSGLKQPWRGRGLFHKICSIQTAGQKMGEDHFRIGSERRK